MRFFAKIENWMCQYALLLKLCAVVLLIFWATKLYVPIGSLTRSIIENNKLENQYAVEISQIQKDMNWLGRYLVEDAKALGENYRPRDFFQDLQTLKKREQQLIRYYRMPNIRMAYEGCHVNVLRSKINVGLGSDYKVVQEMSLCSEEHGKWEKAQLWNQKYDEKLGFSDFMKWVIPFYYRSLFLILLLYLARMADRKGVLETILADKKRFLYSIFLWPLFVSRYPYNVVREIIVRAELRRMGGAFRRLSDAEKKVVIAVANSVDYREWVTSFRAINEVHFRRSFLCALLLVLMIHFFLPALSSAHQSSPVRAGPEIILMVHLDSQDLHDISFNNCNYAHFECLIWQENYVCELPILKGNRHWNIDKWWDGAFAQKIDHVPLRGCLRIS